MGRAIDLTGQKFGRLTIIQRDGSDKNGDAKWECFCECGNVTSVRGTHLRDGDIVSCGCATKDRLTVHGYTHIPEYRDYFNMIRRCEYKNAPYYRHYGGRGIKVCPEWRDSFERFYNDMGPKPSPELSIDRIDPNGDYEPSNCRWATRATQTRNTRLHKTSTTGVRGVSWSKDKQKYRAMIYVNNKQKFAGYFDTIEEARVAREKAEAMYWGDER